MQNKLLEKLFQEYKLTEKDQQVFLSYISDIYIHSEFQRRLTEEFLHHDEKSLGEHILEDAILTYKLSKKYVDRPGFNQKSAVLIAMFHDLYELPWQNNPESNTKKFRNKHGFRHPIEAAINAINWYPQYFEDDEAFKIIDGIIHHMYPLPVNYFYPLDNNPLELKNLNNASKLKSKYIKLFILSTSKHKIGPFSISKSRFKEGRLMAKADKKVSINNYRGSKLGSITTLLNGKNKHLK